MMLAIGLLMAFLAPTPEWTRFRGPNGGGSIETGPLPVEFGKDRNLLWRTPIAAGYSSPVISEKCIYLTAFEWPNLFTVCVSRAGGTVAWQQQTGAASGRKPSVNTPVSSTPVTDGHNVYVFIEAAGIVSYDETGKERWRVDLGKLNNPYGMAASPILEGNTLIMQVDQDTNSFLLALDARTGKQLWRVERPDAQHGYSTPIIYRPRRGPAQVILSASFQVAGYALANGEKLWWVDGMAWQAKSTPVLAGDVLYVHSWMAEMNEIVKLPRTSWEEFLSEYDKDKDGAIAREEAISKEMAGLWFLFDLDRSGRIEKKDFDIIQARNTARSGLFAIQLGGTGNLTASAVKWKAEKTLPNIPSPLLYRDVLYVLKEGGILTSYQPGTGAIAKQGRIEGAIDAYYASLIASGGLLISASQKGKVAVLKAGAEWEVLKVNDLEEEIWSTPAIDDGKLYVRTQSALYCFGLKP